MANLTDDLKREIYKFLNNKSNTSVKNYTGFDVSKEVETLKKCMLTHTKSKTVKNSITSFKKGDKYIITFDNEKANLPSIFNKYPNYTKTAYMPMLRNEGYEVKDPHWRDYFGKGGFGVPENFIEKGITSYQMSGGKLTDITVNKTFE